MLHLVLTSRFARLGLATLVVPSLAASEATSVATPATVAGRACSTSISTSIADASSAASVAALDAATPSTFHTEPSRTTASADTRLTPRDRSAILRACRDRAYAATSARDVGVARNAAQDATTRFDARGFETSTTDGAWSFGLELEQYGFAGAPIAVCEPRPTHADGARVVAERDALVEEWWVNAPHGLEHGLTLRARPHGADGGPLTLVFARRGNLRPTLRADALGLGLHADDGREVLTYDGLAVFDAAGHHVPARLALLASDRVVLALDDARATYPLTIDPTVQRAYLKASNVGQDDEFGYSVAVSGDTVVVGAPFEDSAATGVGGNGNDNSATEAGAAYVFVRQGAAWTQQAYLKASNTGTFDQFGWSVAISGDTIVVGAPGESSGSAGVNGNPFDESAPFSGAAYVFTRTGTTWTQEAYVKASNPDVSDSFGWSVAISGDTIAVGSLGEASAAIGVNGNPASNALQNAGAAYVFTRSGATWSQEAYVKASNTNASDFFGASVGLSGDVLVVGAFGESSTATGVNGNQGSNGASQSGAAYAFARTGTTWVQEAYLKASNTEWNDRFGHSVAVSGSRIVVGAPLESSNATGVNGNGFNNLSLYSGAAYVYERAGTSWFFTTYLKASNTGSTDELGHAVSISGNTILVGARYENGSSTGLDGSQLDSPFSSAGAAYAFEWANGAWSQAHYVKSSNTGPSDQFGYAVAIDGDLMVVGAKHEDGGSPGVNGAQNDESAPHAGAAYAYVRTPDPVAYCAGDGTASACPCGNGGGLGRGCANSLNSSGARLSVTGVASVGADTLVLTAQGVPNGPGLHYQGTASIAAGAGFAFGDGLRCVGGTVIRLGLVTATASASSYPSGTTPPNGVPVSVKGFVAAGDVRHYQCWYRDADPSYCTPSTFNWTNAVSVPWGP